MDTREYEWADIGVVMAGRNVTGFRNISYTESQEKESLYAKGDKPHGIQHGNKSYSGTVTLLQSELDAIETAAGGDLLDARMNIVVSYGNPSKGDVIKTDLISSLEFTEVPKGMAQNDKFAEIELPFIALDIRRNYA